MNDTETIIKYLKLYNEWRRGDEKMGQPNPTEIGKLIDEACEKLASLERERDEALKEVEHWKDSLKLLGETPEQVFESWRIRHTKMFNYIRIMTVWREKYNISKKENDNAKKEAEYYRERYNQLKDELKS